MVTCDLPNEVRLMVPWPIALLALFYSVVATMSAASMWKVLTGAVSRPIAWPLLWLVLSAGAMCGLPLLQAWGRRFAVWTSSLLTASTLAGSALLVASGRPVEGLAVTFSAVFHLVVIRYLQRPAVKAYFA